MGIITSNPQIHSGALICNNNCHYKTMTTPHKFQSDFKLLPKQILK